MIGNAIGNFAGARRRGLSLSAETKAYINDLTTPLSSSQITRIDTFIKALKSGLGISALSEAFDVMYILAGETEESSLKNLVSDAFHCTNEHSTLWTQFEGFTGDGVNDYLNTGYTPSENASKYTLNNNSFGIYSRTDKTETSIELGAEYSTNKRSYIIIRHGSNDSILYNNSGSLTILDSVFDSKGVFISNRTAADAMAAYRNNVLIGSGTTAVGGLPNVPFSILACNDDGINDSFSSRQVAFAFIGRSLSESERGALGDAIEAYMVANGKPLLSPIIYRVSDDGITRIHDLINDPDPVRNCIWGVTRSDTVENYVFKMDKDTGAITKASILEDGFNNKGMYIDWGGGYLWVANIAGDTHKYYLIKIDPDTMARTYYAHSSKLLGSCLTYDNGYVYVAHNSSGPSIVVKFNVAAETYSDIAIANVNDLYWSVFDGTYHWFAGEMTGTGNGALVRIDSSDNVTVFDLGQAISAGGEIAYSDGYIWKGTNTENILVRFNVTTNEFDIIDTSPWVYRLVAPISGKIWVQATTTQLANVDKTTLVITPALISLSNILYSHGLTSDDNYAWVGTWQDSCYIHKIPLNFNI